MVLGLCEAYQALPVSGGVLDQPITMLRMQTIRRYLRMRVENGQPAQVLSEAEEWALAMPMETLG